MTQIPRSPEDSVRDFLDSHFAGLQKHFEELGDYHQLLLAFKTCVQFGVALPDWVAAEAEAALVHFFKRGGAEGRGKRGGNLTRH